MQGICRSSWTLCLYEIENEVVKFLELIPKTFRLRTFLGINSKNFINNRTFSM